MSFFVLQCIAGRCIVVHMTKHADGIAAEIRAAAARKRFTQDQLGDVLHVSRMGIYRRLSGKVPFSVDELYALADALDVDVQEFIAAGKKHAA